MRIRMSTSGEFRQFLHFSLFFFSLFTKISYLCTFKSANCMTMTRHSLCVGLAFLGGFVYRLILGLQGFDAIDMGFSMTFYQNFFQHPDAIPFYFNFYLTGLLGGCWEWAFGQWGLLGFRVLETLLGTLSIACVYGAFRPYLRPTGVAVVAILVSFLFPTVFITFYYNTLSLLLMAASVFMMRRWLQSERLLWLMLAGVWVGVSFFARTVNGTWGILVIVPFLTRSKGQGARGNWREGWKNALTYVGGIACGAGTIFLLMVLLGHLPYFLEGLGEAMGTLSHDEASHSSSNLLVVYLKSALNVGILAAAMMAISWLYAYGQKFPTMGRKAWSLLLLAGLGALVLTNRPYASALAGCTILLVLAGLPSIGRMLYAQRAPREFVVMAAYALVAAYVLPLGSDTGIESIFNKSGVLLIVPAACCWQWLGGKWQRQMTGWLCIFVCIGMLKKTMKRAYGENYGRLDTTTVALPGTLNVMVHEEKATRYQNVVARVAEFGEQYPCMFVGNQMAELYYATGKWPFTGNTMLNSFKGEKLIKRLDKRAEHYGQLPLVVYVRYGKKTEKQHISDAEEARTAIAPWMERHQYRSVYKDDDMEIFVPNG